MKATLYTFYNKVKFGLFILIFNLKLFFGFTTFPYKITLKLNNNCNLKCNFCNIWKNKKMSFLDFNILKKFIQNYGNNIRILSYTGGEIFLLQDIEDKISYALTNCNKLRIFSLTTNGFLTQKIIKIAKNLLEKHPNKIIIINISIDGAQDLHNSLRGNKLSYINAIKTYKQLQEIKHKHPNLEINQEFLLSEQNEILLEEKIKDKNTIISIIQNSDYYGVKDLNIKKFKISKDILSKSGNYLKKKFLKGYIEKNYDCFAIKSSLFIDWTGDIKPCIKWNKTLGNIRNNNLIELLNSKEIKKTKNIIQQKKCPGCWTPCEGYLSIIHQPWK